MHIIFNVSFCDDFDILKYEEINGSRFAGSDAWGKRWNRTTSICDF